MKRRPGVPLVKEALPGVCLWAGVAAGLVAAVLMCGLVPRIWAGGISSGGGARSSGSTRLTDVLGAFGAGRTTNESGAIETGYATFVAVATPVRLVDFTASSHDGAVHLSWRVTDDSDAIGFHVERSVVGAEGPFERMTAEPLGAAVREYEEGSGLVGKEGASVWFRLSALTRNGGVEVLGVIEVHRDILPTAFRTYPAFPNPTKTGATFAIDLPARTQVTILLFDVGGRQVATVFDGALDAGRHQLGWDGRSAGEPVAAGIYFARVVTPLEVKTSRVVVRR